MPKFKYKAKKGPSQVLDGIIDADNVDSALKKIIKQGMTPIDIAEHSSKIVQTTSKKDSSLDIFKRKKISQGHIVDFTRQLADLVGASVPILRSLQIISRQINNSGLKTIIDDIYKTVQDGSSFSEALSKHPRIFSRLYVNMVRTGEVSGNLDKVLERLADHLEKDRETRSKIRSSLAYPLLILAVGILTVFILLTFVIPNLTVMFDDLGQELPWPTILLINISSVFSRYWWAIVGMIIVAAFYFKKWINTSSGKRKIDSLQLKIPFLKDFITITEIGSFSRTLGTLVESGVAITVALNTVTDTINNIVIQEQVRFAADEVTNGVSLRKALAKCEFFPEMSINMISVGEETGKLDKGLYKIADTFERQSDQVVKTMISLLGPIVLIFIVALVGFVVIAMLLPIFQMNLLIQ